jgi:hypothetical protein
VNVRVLDPREQQQQAEHRLDINRDEEQRIDVEAHRWSSVNAPQMAKLLLCWKRMDEDTTQSPCIAKGMVSGNLSSFSAIQVAL